MLAAHKIALKPNNVQATYFARAAGTARFAYNWALAEWGRQYAAWTLDNTQSKPSQMAMGRALNAIKKEAFPWMLEVTKNAPQMAIIQLGAAFQNFFAGRAKYPKPRKKGVHDRFSLSNDQFSVESSRIRIPRLGWVRMREALRLTGKIMSATVSRVADQWFVSITVDTLEQSTSTQAENQGAVGVDLGVSALATLSTGEPPIPGPKAHKVLLCRLQRLSRGLSRKVKGSQNRKKARMKLARLHARISNIRKDALHQLTTDLTRRFHTIGIEDLNVKGMLKNRHLSRAVSDMGFFEFRRQLEYKAAWRGRVIVVADRWYPSSKTCSCCGHKLDELPLSVRQWTCPGCNTTHDRDVNAAVNLKNLAVSSTVSVCGEEGSGSGRKTRTKPASVKQKVSFVPCAGMSKSD
ncbi:MAG: RNA-guided endonuclease TnpB family protein [Polaromonas sp.]|nr:RNA-guided endonuclease TnpB family protein [Polaromonas sp.]